MSSVQDLAAELGVTAGAIIDCCESLGFSVDGRSSVLSVGEVERVRVELGRGSTRRDGGLVAGGGTRRDGTRGGDGSGSGLVQFDLGVFGDRFDLVEPLDHGGEGFVLLVRDRDADDRLVVLKAYHRDFEVETTALETLSGEGVDHDHVVKIVDFGRLDDGTCYEVQEYCEQGTLRDLFEGDEPLDAGVVVDELAAALTYVHGLGVVHRDVKPENVLVKALEPLDLVLTDFGLVRQVEGSHHLTTRAGSAPYAPPEGVTDEVRLSPAWDWWSLGMIVAELAAGTHPLALPDRSFPPVHEMRSELTERPVDLEAVTNDRLRLLCSGLLVRDRRERWGTSQVESWQQGESPPVNDTAPSSGVDAARPSVRYQGEEIDNPATLAAAFQQAWSSAVEDLFQDPDRVLIEDTVDLCHATGRDQAARLLTEQPERGALLRHFARFLAALDPHLNPVFEGIDLTPAGLETAATRVIEHNDHTTAATLDTIRNQRILHTWRHLPHMTNANAVHEAWEEKCSLLDDEGRLRSGQSGSGSEAKLQKVEAERAHAWFLLVATDGRHLGELQEARSRLDTEDAERLSWWRALDSTEAVPELVAGFVTYERATADGRALAEKERQAALEKEQADRAEAERRRLEQRKRRRDVTGTAILTGVLSGAVLGGVVGTVAGFMAERARVNSDVTWEPLVFAPWMLFGLSAGIVGGLLVARAPRYLERRGPISNRELGRLAADSAIATLLLSAAIHIVRAAASTSINAELFDMIGWMGEDGPGNPVSVFFLEQNTAIVVTSALVLAGSLLLFIYYLRSGEGGEDLLPSRYVTLVGGTLCLGPYSLVAAIWVAFAAAMAVTAVIALALSVLALVAFVWILGAILSN